MRIATQSVAVALVLALSSCGDRDLDPDRDAAVPADGERPIGGDGATSGDVATVSFGPHPTAVGLERTVCVVVDAGNAVARQVRAIRTSLPTGSHHLIVYRSGEPLRDEPTPCFPFADGAEAIFIAETVDAALTYPEDAGLAFDAHQHIRLEIHEVNYTGGPIDITASVSFDFYPLEEPARDEVRFLFTGNTSLDLPPRTTTEVTSFHSVPDGARIFALTSHTHSLGTYASIEIAGGELGAGELVHEATNWAEPPLDLFSPPRVIDPNGLRLTCRFYNDREERVAFGLDFDDEMCFLWAYYY
jgi:hypothetical protein